MLSKLSVTVIAPIVSAVGVFPKLRKSCSFPDRTEEKNENKQTGIKNACITEDPTNVVVTP